MQTNTCQNHFTIFAKISTHKMFYFNLLVMMTIGCSVTTGAPIAPTPGGGLVLLVSFDGFRWDYLNRGITPTFNDIAAKGGKTRNTINAFITKTFPNHYTLVNGLYEESHGIVGNNMYDPTLDATFSLSNLDPKWWSQNGQIEPIWITNQRFGGSSGVVDYPGMDVPFDGMLPNYEYKSYSSKIPFNDRSNLAVALLSNGSANFVALYFHEPDRTGHRAGPDSKEMDDMLKFCDKTLKYLQEKLVLADLWDKVNLIVTSDHGMASVDDKRTIYADQYLNGTEFPYFTVENNPVLGIWPNDSSNTDALYNAMKKAPHVTVYKKDEIPPHFHYKDNIRTPPIVVAADLGWMVKGRMGAPSNSSRPYKGTHGYNNLFPEMHPIFLAHGPAFKSGSVCEPFNSVDVYPLMCHLLGIKERPNNGTLKTVRALLKDPSAPKNINDVQQLSHHNGFFTLGLAFATIVGLLAVVLVAGMCLKQRGYRQTEMDYRTLGKLIESEDEEIFEDRDMMLPNTNI